MWGCGIYDAYHHHDWLLLLLVYWEAIVTNREYMESLSSEELAKFLYFRIFNGVGPQYPDSIAGVADWLDEEYKEPPKRGIYRQVDG